MGWFGNWFGGDKPNSSGDPLKDLDPSLRDFLEKEAPIKYHASNPPAPERPRAEPPKAGVPTAPTPSVAASKEESTKPVVPPESLFQDGRYAHLWKNYQTQAEIDSVTKSNQERIDDILHGFKRRKQQIGKAALDNCADILWDQNECFSNPNFQQQMSMCRNETRALGHCFRMQAKLLKALGYMSSFDDPAHDEKIQMHADHLYHQFLDQMKVVEQARAEGKPIPKFPPVISPEGVVPVGIPSSIKQLPSTKPRELQPHVQERLKKRLKDLPEGVREIEEMAILDEMRATEKVARKLGNVYGEANADRKERKEKGEETIFERFVGVANRNFDLSYIGGSGGAKDVKVGEKEGGEGKGDGK